MSVRLDLLVRRARPNQVLKHSILLLATFVALVPSVFMIMTSLKSQEEYTFNKAGLPQDVVLDHFHSVLFDSGFFGWMGNSIIQIGRASCRERVCQYV